MNNYILSAVLLLLGASSLSAQVVRFPGPPAAWTVKIGNQAEAEAAPAPESAPNLPEQPVEGSAPPELRGVEVIAARDLTRSVTRWSDGRTREAWWVNASGWLLMDNPAGRGVVLTSSITSYVELKPDVTLFAWVAESNFVRELTYAGKKCRYHRGSGSVGMALPPSASGQKPVETIGELQAWIEVETGLPVAFDDGRTRYTFAFQAAPAELPAMPARFAEELTRAREAELKPRLLGRRRSWEAGRN